MTQPNFDSYVLRAQKFLNIQRQRSAFFSDNFIFDNPPWEMLLEIFIATEQESCISLEKLAERLTAPKSIISRWVDVFADRRYLVWCEQHEQPCLRLTDGAREQCAAYLDAIAIK